MKLDIDQQSRRSFLLRTGGVALGVAFGAPALGIAEQALALIDVEYEVLPPVMDLRTATAPGASTSRSIPKTDAVSEVSRRTASSTGISPCSRGRITLNAKATSTATAVPANRPRAA